jgi:hypothetical protein
MVSFRQMPLYLQLLEGKLQKGDKQWQNSKEEEQLHYQKVIRDLFNCMLACSEHPRPCIARSYPRIAPGCGARSRWRPLPVTPDDLAPLRFRLQRALTSVKVIMTSVRSTSLWVPVNGQTESGRLSRYETSVSSYTRLCAFIYRGVLVNTPLQTIV